MVKAYLRYELAGSWGVIASANCNVCYDRKGRHLLTASLENVSVWNVKQAALVSANAQPLARTQPGPPLLPLPAACCQVQAASKCAAAAAAAALCLTQVKTLIPPISQSGKVAGEVTQIAASPAANQIAVGHADGTVRRRRALRWRQHPRCRPCHSCCPPPPADSCWSSSMLQVLCARMPSIL